jgi:hypothetical protein
VAAWQPPLVLRRTLTFERALFEPHELEPALDRLARSLALDLGGRAARHVTVATEGSDGARFATRVAKRPLHRAGQIRQQALFALRDSGAAEAGIDALTVELAEPERVAEAAGLWDARAHRDRAVDSVLERHPRALVQVRWGDPHAPAADLAWSWGTLEDAARPDAEHRPTRATARAVTPARRGLEAPVGAIAPTALHAAPLQLAQADRPTVDAPVRTPHTEARPLPRVADPRWTRPLPATPSSPLPAPDDQTRDRIRDPLRDPDLVRAERWPGTRRVA